MAIRPCLRETDLQRSIVRPDFIQGYAAAGTADGKFWASYRPKRRVQAGSFIGTGFCFFTSTYIFHVRMNEL